MTKMSRNNKGDNFYLSGLVLEKKGEKIVIKGNAAVANKVHAHGYSDNMSQSFRSYFTDKALEKMNMDLKYKPIFVDALHSISAKMNNDHIIDTLIKKNPDLETDLKSIKSNLDISKVPMFKLSDFKLTDDGKLEVEIESNPLYPEVDDEHKKWYNVITGSVESGYINGISVNFVATEVTNENGIDKINDLDLFGLSLVDGPAMGCATEISEVATRSIKRIIEMRKTGETEMETEKVVEKAVPPKVQEVDIDAIVSKKIDAEIKRRELEAQKQSQDKELEKMKQELEQLKKEKESSGSKGTPKVEKPIDPEWIKQQITNMNDNDLMQLYHEFVLNGKTAPLIKSASHKGKSGDPRVTWEFQTPSSSMAEVYKQMLYSKNPGELNFSRRG